MAITRLVTEPEVQNICPTKIDIAFAINAAIDLMNATVDGFGLPDNLLRSIQLQLSAHFVAVADPRVRDENYAGARFRYEVPQEAPGLASTRYGQAAIALDTTGQLATVGKKATSFEVLAWRP